MLVVEGDLSRVPLTAGVDNVQGAQLATRHLLELGHHTVVQVAGPPGWAEATARVEGWRLELEAWGRPVPPLRWGGDWSARSGYAAGASLARDPDVTAIFAANDQMAIGVMAALREAPGCPRTSPWSASTTSRRRRTSIRR
jgi:DNA-binding LacI/PurR family transcriptional regulator